MIRYARLALFVAAYAAVFPALGQDIISPEASTGRSGLKGATAKSYMVVAANPYASQAGAEILKAGGSAVDAAIAVQLVLTMVEPQSSGVGGGAFLINWDAKAKSLTTYDGRETAPQAATEQRFLTPGGAVMDRREAIMGGKSIGVPGVMRMLEMAHAQHGRLPWARLFQPAIKLADNGFAISPRLHDLLVDESALKDWQPAGKFFYQSDGTPKPVGTMLKNPEFAVVLRALAKDGAKAFYTGKIAADIVRAATTAQHNPSDMTLEDLAAYQAKERPPVCGAYRDRKICGMGPPSSGGVGVIQTLGVMEHFDIKAMGPGSIGAYHLMAEGGRLALADRAVYLADPDVIPVPTDALIAPDYLASRAALVRLDHRMEKVDAGKVPVKTGWNLVPAGSPEIPSTSHFSIIDKYGDAVAMTTSVESAFGSYVMVDGFILNNQLTDFSYSDVAERRTVANRVEGGKRPRSSMAPTLVFDKNGKFEIAVGSPGGVAIVGFVAKALAAMIDWDMTPAEAVAIPHIIPNLNGIEVEQGTPLETNKAAFEALGHQVRLGNYPSGLHAIRVMPDGRILGGADPRREGVAIGE